MGCTCEKPCKQGHPLSNTIKDTSTIMRNPMPELYREGLRMIVLVSLIVLVLLRGFPCFHDFSHSASHPYILIHSIFALVPLIFIGFVYNMRFFFQSYARTRMRGLPEAIQLKRASFRWYKRSSRRFCV